MLSAGGVAAGLDEIPDRQPAVASPPGDDEPGGLEAADRDADGDEPRLGGEDLGLDPGGVDGQPHERGVGGAVLQAGSGVVPPAGVQLDLPASLPLGELVSDRASAGESAKQFELFAEAGGTLIDTANKYTNGTAESILGELLAADRDHFMVGTKYSLNVRDGDLNAGGNHRKSLVQALEASLRRLRTDHVDILWLHAWDYVTPAGEVMRALDDRVRLGKVLYLGISDTPAWVAAQMQTLAAERGWSAFAGLQVEYSLVQREVERGLIPMAWGLGLGLGVLAWGPLGAGVLPGKYACPAPAQAPARRASAGWPTWTPAAWPSPGSSPTSPAGWGWLPSVVALAGLRAQGGVIPHDFLASQDFVFGGLSGQLDRPPGRSSS